MQRQNQSQAVSEDSLWKSVAPKYQSVLTTPQTLKVFSTSFTAGSFKAGTISVAPCNPAELLVTMNSSVNLALAGATLIIGYSALHLLFEYTQAQVNPRQCLCLQGSNYVTFLQFDSEDTCGEWSKALKKLLKLLHPDQPQEKLGHLFDISEAGRGSRAWCELKLTLVTEDHSTEDFARCSLSEASSEKRLFQIEQSLNGAFDCINARILRRYLEDLSIMHSLSVNQRLYSSMQPCPPLPFGEVTPTSIKAFMEGMQQLDRSQTQVALRIAFSKLSFARQDALAKAFQVLHLQKLQTVFAGTGTKSRLTRQQSGGLLLTNRPRRPKRYSRKIKQLIQVGDSFALGALSERAMPQSAREPRESRQSLDIHNADKCRLF